MLFNYLSLSVKSKRSQSALEYMMTYGWAILIIVIVAVILYSMGIFNPSSSITSTVTGFSGLGSVTAQCTANGVLRISVGDSTGNLINITGITAKDPAITKISNFKPNSTVDPNPLIRSGSSYIFSVPNICPSAGTHYAITVTVNYTEPGQPLPGPYSSIGSITGVTSSELLPAYVASFNGEYPNPSSSYITQTFVWPKSFTISFWVNLDSVSGKNSNESFIHIDNSGDMSELGLISGRFIGVIWDNPNMITDYATAGKWYMVSLTFSLANANQSLFLNGKLVDSFVENISYPSAGGSYQLRLGFPQTNETCVFTNPYCNIIVTTISGQVSGFQFYGSVLSPTQISKLYSSGPYSSFIPSQSILAWWPLNGTSSDFSGNLNNGAAYDVFYTSNYNSLGLP